MPLHRLSSIAYPNNPPPAHVSRHEQNSHSLMSKILGRLSNIPPPSLSSDEIIGIRLMLLLLLTATSYAAAQPTTDLPDDGYGSGNINPSMTVIVVVLLSAFLLMVSFAIYIRKCTDDDGSSVAYRFPTTGLSRRSPRGLDASVIESFPIIAYSAVKNHKIGEGAPECAVCLNMFTGEECLRMLPKCDHVFHPECIDAWLAFHTTCPVCRDDLKINSGEFSGDTETRGELNDSAGEQSPGSESCETPDQISVNVEDGGGHLEEVVGKAKKSETPKKSRQVAEKLPRSHSTGHLMVRPGENQERYTLRIPDGLRRQIMSQRLNRTTSCIVVLPPEASSRTGYRRSEEESGRGWSDRWVFTTAAPFLMRSGSVRAAQVWNDGGSTAESDVVAKTRTRPPI